MRAWDSIITGAHAENDVNVQNTTSRFTITMNP